MSNNVKPCFFFVSKGEKKWERESKSLQQYFQLLADPQLGSRFELFLSSPFHVKDDRYGPLFTSLYQKFSRPNGKPIRIVDLLRKVYSSNDESKYGSKLRRLLRGFPPLILQFRAHVELMDKPIESARLTAQSIRDQGHLSIYDSCCDEWETVAENLPLGSARAYHRWAVADARHFSLDVKKGAPNPARLATTQRTLAEFFHLESLLLHNEKLNCEKLFGETGVLPGSAPLPDALTLLYEQLLALQSEQAYNQQGYERLKADYLAVYDRLEDLQQVAIYLFLLNYISSAKRKGGNDDLAYESLFWTRFALSQGIYLAFPSIPKSSFLNRLQNALTCGDIACAREVIDKLGPRLATEDQSPSLLEADIAMDFYQHRYHEAIEKIRSTDHQSWKDQYVDNLRLKSYRLRANLCLCATDLAHHEEAEKALIDFEKYYGRHLNGFSELRRKEFKQFLSVCRRLLTYFTRLAPEDDYHKIQQLLKQEKVCNSRLWLLDFMQQINPRAYPQPSKIQPKDRGRRESR